MYIDDKLPKNIVLSWLNIRPLLKQFNQSKKYELKKNDLISHLKNIQKYFRLHDLQIENDYVIELKSMLIILQNSSRIGKLLKLLIPSV